MIFGERDMPERSRAFFIVSVVLTFWGVFILIAAIICMVLIATNGLHWGITLSLLLLGSLCLIVGALMQRSIAKKLDEAKR